MMYAAELCGVIFHVTEEQKAAYEAAGYKVSPLEPEDTEKPKKGARKK